MYARSIAAALMALLYHCQVKQKEVNKPAITIDVWYSDHQRFGDQGLPQKWINLFGSVKCS